jgi:heat shock protein HslJ
MKNWFLSSALLLLFSCNNQNTKSEASNTQPAQEQPEAQSAPLNAASADVPTLDTSVGFAGKKWILKELIGKPVGEVNGKTPYVQFTDTDTRISADGGCNKMSGTYTLSDVNRITFSQMISTKMACPDMQVEDKLAEVLGKADNYYLTKDSLILYKARMAALAIFVAE